MLYNAEHQDTLAAMNHKHHAASVKPREYRGKRGAVREVRDEIQDQRKDAAQKYRAGKFTEHYTESDALKAERARNQAARERQEQARQEPQPEKTQTTSAQAKAAAEQEARILARRQKGAELERENGQRGRELKP